MNRLLIRKINLLTHLANVDGRFDVTERKLLMNLCRETGIAYQETDISDDDIENVADFQDFEKRADLLYWCLRMMAADGVIHEAEEIFCREMAVKLGFQSEVADWFVKNQTIGWTEFQQEAKRLISTG